MKNKSILLLGLLVAAAAAMFVSQTKSGLSVTGLHEPVVWGAYVVCFTFFVGAGTGLLLILSFCMFREDIDIFLVPGTKFDKEGNRKGHGKGYFDRFLEEVKGKKPIVGLCYEGQIVKKLETNNWDIPMDSIIAKSH